MVNAVYDPEEKTDKSTNLADLENGSTSDASGSSDDPNTNAYQTPGSPQLNNAEGSNSSNNSKGSENSSKNDSNSGGDDTLGKGFTGEKNGAEGGPNKKKSLVTTLSQNKKGIGASGGVIGLTIAILISFGSLVNHEIVTLEKDLLNYESRTTQKFAEKKAQHLMQRMICWQIPAGCKGKPDPTQKTADENAKPTPEEIKAAANEGGTLATEMNNVKLTDPTISSGLDKQGLSVKTDSVGNLTGITDSTGADVTESVATSDQIATKIETGVPEANVGVVDTLLPLEVEHAGASFEGLKETASEDVNKTIEAEILDGASAAELKAAELVSTETATTSSNGSGTTPPTQATVDAANAGAAETNALLDTANQDIAKGKGISQVIDDVKAKFGGVNAGSALNVNTAIADVCQVKGIADTASKTRVPKLMDLLVRHFSLITSLADQVKTGHISSKKVAAFMKLMNGNSAASPIKNKDGTKSPSPDSLPFSSSSTWQSAIGSGGGIPIDASAKPVSNAGSGVVNQIDNVLHDIPGANAICVAENSKVGSIGGTIIGFGFTASGLLDFGLSDVISAGFVGSVQYAIDYQVIPYIVKYFTPAGIYGLESAVSWMNNAGAGTNLAFGDYARSMGANPVTNATASVAFAEATKEQNAINSKQSIINKTIAFSNPNSVVSKITVNIPLGLNETISSITSFFTSAPSILGKDMAAIFMPKAFADSTPTPPGQDASITQYLFTDGEINKYDPIANEQYLLQKITVSGQTKTRLEMLGNPNKYTPSPSGDTNYNDLLHCYVDSAKDIYQDNLGTSYAHFCNVIGSYDSVGKAPADQAALSATLEVTIAQVYSQALGCSNTCISQSQLNDDIGHYRQYLLDVHVMNNFTNLINKK